MSDLNQKEPILIIESIEDLEKLLEWNVSQNHTKRYGCIKGTHSRSYNFMNEDKNEVLNWLILNYKNE